MTTWEDDTKSVVKNHITVTEPDPTTNFQAGDTMEAKLYMNGDRLVMENVYKGLTQEEGNICLI